MKRYGSVLMVCAPTLTLLFAFAGNVDGATIHVPSEQATIQAAIDAAANGDEIVLALGVYTGSGNRDLNMKGKAVTVRSTDPDNPDAVAATIINCQGTASNPHRAFCFQTGEGADSVLAGLTIANGYGPDQYFPRENEGNTCGGAILCLEGTAPTIRRCSFLNHYGGWGGAILLYRADATISHCSFDTCVGEHGGAVFCRWNTPLIQNCTATRCEGSVEGGAIRFWHTTNGRVTHCVMSESISWGGGAFAAFCDSGLIVDNCLMHANLATAGGAMAIGYTTASIINCTLTANQASFAGGAISTYFSDTAIGNCIFWDNAAPYYNQVIAGAPGVSISYSNIQGGQEGVWVDDPSSLIWGPGNIESDPLLTGANGQYKYRLRGDSPCVDAGDPSLVPAPTVTMLATVWEQIPATDVYGRDRVVNGRVDIGASEFAPPNGSGDFDEDGDIDGYDFRRFQGCFNGPNRSPRQSGCEVADYDADGDVDLSDFASFEICFNGPNRRSACH